MKNSQILLFIDNRMNYLNSRIEILKRELSHRKTELKILRKIKEKY